MWKKILNDLKEEISEIRKVVIHVVLFFLFLTS